MTTTGNVQKVTNSTVASSTTNAQPQTAATTTTATTAVTIPVVKKTTATTENKGTVVEKTSGKEETTVKTTPVKSKRTIDEAMKISYPGKKDANGKVLVKGWDDMTDEEKQQKIIAHLNSIPKEQFNYLATKSQPDGRIGWLKSFLLNDKMDEKQSRIVVGALKQLDISKEELAELQAQGVKMAFDDDNKNQEAYQLQVVEDMAAYGEKAQKVAVDESSVSTFDKVKIEGAKRASDLKTEVQNYAVQKYMEGSKSSSKNVQKQIGFILVDQYGKYAKEAELGIHKTISSSDISEIVEYAAKNIYHFDKENQAAAVKITTEAGNDAATKAAAEQYDKYDESAREEIKSIINETDCEEAQEALAEAEERAEAEAEAEEIADAEQEEQEFEEKELLESKKEAENKNKTITQKVQDIINSKSYNKNASIRELIKNASMAQKIELLSSLPKSELAGVLSIILQSSPFSSLFLKAMQCLTNIDSNSKKDLIKKMSDSKVVTAQIGSFDTDTQNKFIGKGNLSLINRDSLCATAKKKYDELSKNQGCVMA